MMHRPQAVLAAQAISAGKEVQILANVYVGIGGERVGHEAEAIPYAIRIVGYREPIDKGVARIRLIERGKDPHARGLAGAVWPDVPKDLAAMHLERDVVHRVRPPEVTVNMTELHHRMAGVHN